MKSVEYSGLNFDDAGEIETLARIHESGPLDWIPGFEVLAERVEARAKVFAESKDNANTTVFTARNEQAKVIAFHWISLVENDDHKAARIESLWVHEDYRRMGIATELKHLGEKWARKNGATAIKTTVFYVNKRMIELNIQLDFVPGQLEMTKKIHSAE